jgi:peptidyl-prolyl cis-trans isomerase SurA
MRIAARGSAAGVVAALVIVLAPGSMAGQDTTAKRDSLRDTTAVAPIAPPPARDTLAADTTARADTVARDSLAIDILGTDSTAAPAVGVPSVPADSQRVAAVVPPDSVVVVDRVIAVVGNRPVLASQVDEELFSRQAQGAKMPEDPRLMDAMRREVVSSIVDEELLVQQASRDTTIQVTDQEIADGVEQQIRKVRENFTSEVDYKGELKKAGFQTPEEYRRWLTDQQRRAALQNRLIDGLKSAGKLKPVAPTEQEMRKYFEEHKGSLGSRPATLSFRQIVISPKASAAAKAKTRAQADSIVLELRRGADFATAARRFSQDPGSRDQGGSLNWFRRGVMVPEFERVAFSLKPGTVSDPVESPFGFHIIQVERTQPAEIQARHILLIPEIDSANVDSARALANRLHQLVSKGAAFDSLQRAYHDPSGGERQAENVPADKLPEAYAGPVANADSGAVVPVFTIKGPGERDQYVVLQVTNRRLQGEIRYEDVKDRIRQQLGQELAIRRYIDQLRKSTYVELRI